MPPIGPLFAMLLTCAVTVRAQMNSQPPDTTYYLPVTNVGSNSSGTAVPLYGCTTNGATLQQLSFWANDQWMRGMTASLTDGRQILAGCLNVTGNATANIGCTDANIRNANFTLQSGERIMNLTLYPGYNLQGQTNRRAGGLNITTSMGRYFSFGMTAPWQNGTSIDVGAGIPCGVAPKAGADVDTLGFIFLRNITANALQSVQYSGVSSSGTGDVTTDVAPLQESANLLVLSNQTYNNTGKTTSLVATFASQADLSTTSQWTYALGLDSYTMAPVNGFLPQVVDYSTNSNVSWTLQNDGLHNRNESHSYQEAWNYTVTIGPHGASQITASATEGNITATFMARLNVTLDSGVTFSVPVSGLYMGGSTSPVHVNVQELAAATAQTMSSNSGGHDNTVAWVVGVLIGIICGLLLAALLAWAIVLIMRRRNKKTPEPEAEAMQSSPKSRNCLPVIPPIAAFFGKGKGVALEDLQKDVELGKAGGKGKWTVDDMDSKFAPAPVVGVPVPKQAKDTQKQTPQEGDLPESEGTHVLPYNMFRRLRLESIRRNLAHESPDLTPVSRAQARLEQEESERLSNPPSNASTPRTIPEVSGRQDRHSVSSEAGAESIEAHSEQDARGFGRAPHSDDKVELFAGDSEDEKAPVILEDADRRQRMKDRIAQRMADRTPTPPRRSPIARRGSSGSSSQPQPKVTLMDKISGQIASYRSKREMASPSGLNQREMQGDVMRHGGKGLQLGAGYKSAEPSGELERNTVQHDDQRIRLGQKYETQGRNE